MSHCEGMPIPIPNDISTPLGNTPDMSSIPNIYALPHHFEQASATPNKYWNYTYGGPPTSMLSSTPPQFQFQQYAVNSPLAPNMGGLNLSGQRTRRDSYTLSSRMPNYTPSMPQQTPQPLYVVQSPPNSFGTSPNGFFYGNAFANMNISQQVVAQTPVYAPQNSPRTVYNQPPPHQNGMSGFPSPVISSQHTPGNRRPAAPGMNSHSRVSGVSSNASEKANVARSQQLDDFRNSRLPHLQLSDLGKNVVEFAKGLSVIKIFL